MERATRDYAMRLDVENIKKKSLFLAQNMGKIRGCEREEELLGLEGEAASVYFSVFDELIECDEGELCWVDKAMVPNLPAWEGDQVFLDLLLSGEKRFFSVKLQYEGDRLVEKKIHLY